MCSEFDLKNLRRYWYLETYDDLCYSENWKDWCFNLLNKDCFISKSDTPNLNGNIKELIENLCWHKKENIEYLHKAIFYKYTHIDDFTIPAIVFYWAWWSWKWTFISLLSTIFWEKNVLWNLWQREISWNFDTYKWKKLVVSFDEISTNNTNSDMKILNKLKNIIWAEKITVNEKWEKQYQTENIAWFFISSNSNQPIQLDDKYRWNRRFCIIKSDTKLKDWEKINKTIRDKKIVSNYLAWLYENFPDVIKYKKLDTLENEDKKELEERSQNEANKFWDWFEETYPETDKIYKRDLIDKYIEKYVLYAWFTYEEECDFNKYFKHSSRYPVKTIRIWEKTGKWYQIR
jgi:hypothetical protein